MFRTLVKQISIQLVYNVHVERPVLTAYRKTKNKQSHKTTTVDSDCPVMNQSKQIHVADRKHEKTWEVFYVHLHDCTCRCYSSDRSGCVVCAHVFSVFKLVVVFDKKNPPTIKQCMSYLLIRVSSTEDDVAEPLDAGSTYVGNT